MIQANTHTPTDERLLRLDDVIARVGLKKSAIYAGVNLKNFPAPVKLSSRALAWPDSVISDRISQRIRLGGVGAGMNQYAILLAYLHQNGCSSCAVLERNCDVRSVTARISEMVAKGMPIQKTIDWETNSRGKPRRVTYYTIRADLAQQDLFSTP